MKARRLEDRAEFCASIDRVEPGVLKAWNKLAAQAPTHVEIAAFLAHWGLDAPGLEWLADGLFRDVRSPTGDPWPGPRYPSFGLPVPADGVPTHDMPPLVLSWEPGETGEDRTAFLKRARERLEAYAAAVETWRRERGIELPAREHDRGEVESGRVRWDLLASKLVLGWTDERIGNEVGISKQAAAKHIRALAERLGIALPVRQPSRKP